MNSTPLVTIVTPAFNQAEFLGHTIESVLSQTYPHIEYIVLDDGSTDDTSTVLDRFAGRVIVNRHSNIGQARTLNKGWAMAKGQLLGYLSADDLLAPDAIAESVAVLVARPSTVVTYPDYTLIDSSGAQVRTVATEEFDVKRLTVDVVCQPGPGAIFRRSAYEMVGGWRPDLRQVADYEFWLRMSTQGDFRRIPRALAFWRWHASSASVRPIEESRCDEVVEVMKSFWKDKDRELGARALSRAFCISAAAHFRSRRPNRGWQAYANALKESPGTALSLANTSCVVGGVARGLGIKALG